MSRITPHLRGRYRGKLSRRTPAVDPLVLRPALALTFCGQGVVHYVNIIIAA